MRKNNLDTKVNSELINFIHAEEGKERDKHLNNYKKLIAKRIRLTNEEEEKIKHPVLHILKKIRAILLFPLLYPIIIIDNVLRFLKIIK